MQGETASTRTPWEKVDTTARGRSIRVLMSTPERQPPERLPIGRQISYSIGQLGWSLLVNIIGIQLVYFYIPPQGSGLPLFLAQGTFFVVLNTVTLIAASGRLFDAITDPLIASWSDRSHNPKGRRIPFLAWAPIPAALFCTLMFLPPQAGMTTWNIVWVVVTQLLFFFFITLYVTPFFALLPELSRNERDRLNLSTYISVTWALGLMVAAQVPQLAGILERSAGLEKVRAWQLAIAIFAGLAVLLMYVPVFAIDERRYCQGEPASVPLLQSLGKALRNRSFQLYVVADFAYFCAITIIQTGILYYVKVLLFPGDASHGEALVGQLLPVMVIVSFVMYPVVNVLARRVGKKPLVTGAFLFFGGVFSIVYFLGGGLFQPAGPASGLSPTAQGYLLVIAAAVPMAFLGILPNAVLADIAEHDALKTGLRQEGMFFAARTFLQKFGVTAGVMIFAALTTFGKDPGNDLGVRLSGPVGLSLCLAAALVFMLYDERRLLAEMRTMSKTEGEDPR